MARLPEVLALEDKDVASARAEVGKAIATKYCAAALQQKLTLDAQDQAFVADFGERLGTDLGDVSFGAKKKAPAGSIGIAPYGRSRGGGAGSVDARRRRGHGHRPSCGSRTAGQNREGALFAAEATKAIEALADLADADSVGDVADGYGLSGEDAVEGVG